MTSYSVKEALSNSQNTSEDSGMTPGQIYTRNAPYVAPDITNYYTTLTPQQEKQFQEWVDKNKIPFDPNAQFPDYDMRGFWLGLQSGNPIAKKALDPNDNKYHFPDYWKTPYDATFSAESKFANKNAPIWKGNNLVLPNGQIIYSDKEHKWMPVANKLSIDQLLEQATTLANQGGPGANSAAAASWLKEQLQARGADIQEPRAPYKSSDSFFNQIPDKKVTSTSDRDSFFSQVPEKGQPKDANKPPADTKDINPILAAGQAIDPSNPANKKNFIGEDRYHLMQLPANTLEAIGNLYGSAKEYFTNHHKEHETISPGTVTPKELAAMHLMGVSINNANNEGPLETVAGPDNNIKYNWKSIYKMTPEQRQRLKNKTMEAWGYTPEQEEAVVRANEKGDWSNLNIPAGIMHTSLMANTADRVFNPYLKNSKLYYNVQHTVQAMDIAENPDKYTPGQVTAAKSLLAHYKKDLNTSTWDSVKQTWQAALEHPGATAKGFGYNMLIDPELFGVGEVKAGKALLGAKELASAADLEKATKSMKQAAAIRASAEGSTWEGAKYIAANAKKAESAAESVAKSSAARLKNLGRVRRVLDTASAAGSGAALNAGISAQQQIADQGYVRKGSLGGPAAIGGILGGTFGALGGHEEEVLPADEVRSEKDIPATEEAPSVPQESEPQSTVTPEQQAEGVPPHAENVISAADIIRNAKRQKGAVDKRLLATGVAAGAGAGAGAYFAPPGKKKAAALAGGLAGLFTSVNMYGDSVPRKGFGKQEGMFSGIGSRTFDIKAAKMAQTMEKYGKSPEDIYAATGMSREKSGKWTQEISDHLMELQPYNHYTWQLAKEQPVRVGSLVKHDALFKAYPELMRAVKVRVDPKLTGTSMGYFNPNTRTIHIQDPTILDSFAKKIKDADPNAPDYRAKSVIAHELQHWVQGKEGFSGGASSAAHTQAALQVEALINKRQENIWNKLMDVPPNSKLEKSLMDKYDKLQSLREKYGKSPIPQYASRAFYNYSRVGGESQARNVQARLDLTPEERALLYPGKTEDIPRELQTVSGKPGIQGMSIEPPKDNYRKKLSTFSDKFYHETNVEKGLTKIPYSSTYAYPEEIYLSNSKNLALGQGTNKGLLLEFSPGNMEGVINKSKPGWEHAWRNNEGEFVTRNPSNEDYKNNLQAITIKPDLKVTKPERLRLETTLKRLENDGWTITKNSDGSITYRKPNSAEIKYPEKYSLGDHLQKTQEMSVEGNLHGMTLEEDKLPNEEHVVSKAREGDEQAVSKLYNKYMPRLTRSLRGMLRAAGPRLGIGAEDIAQSAFTKAIHNLPNFRGDSAFYTWLYKIGRNSALNAIKKGEREVPTTSMHARGSEGGNPLEGGIDVTGGSALTPEAERAAAETDTPEGMFIAQQASNMVKHSISKLPNDIREAVKLKEMHGLTEQEIATRQGVPIGTVKSRLFRGRKMLGESIKRGHGANFRKQGGFATVDQLKRLALVGGLGAAGYALGGPQHHIRGAILGSIFGIGAGNINLSHIKDVIKASRAADDTPKASKVLDQLESSTAQTNRHLDFIVKSTKENIPEDRRTALSHYLEGDNSVKLTQQEKLFAEGIRAKFNELLGLAKQVGVINKGIENYVTHIYSKDPKTQELLNQYYASNISQNTKYAIPRKGPPTLKVALHAGMDVETDIANILGHYGQDLNRSIHSKVAIDALKKIKDSQGNPLLMGSKSAPLHYVGSDHPALRNLRMHPAIEAEMSHLFDVYRPGVVAHLYDQLNNAVRRIKLSMSLFHVKNLTDVAMGMSPNPAKNIYDISQAVSGRGSFHEMRNNPVPGDPIDQMIAGGMTGEFSPNASGNIDEGRPLKATLDSLGDTMDKIFPGLGLLTKPVNALDSLTQKLTWVNAWTGLKMVHAQAKVDIMKTNWAREANNDPKITVPSEQELYEKAASFVNTSYGGLNWRRIANEVKNKYLRQIVMSTFAPRGRRALGIMMLAPDFTMATMRHVIKMFGEGTGLKGIVRPRELADLHRQWFIKSTLYYLVMGNAINYAATGHYMWDNQDPLMIDLGDGRKMQWSKVLTDPMRIMAHPQQEPLNKMNPIVQEVLDQLLGVDYLSASGHAPKISDSAQHVLHLMSLLTPIQLSQIGKGGLPSVVSSLLGVPIYGQNKKSKEYIQAEHEKRRAAALKAAKRRREKRMSGEL